MKFPPTAPAWCRRWMSAPPRSPASSAGPKHGTLKVLGSALRESAGLKAGTVTSLDLAEETIRDCVAAAENHADARIQNVLIAVNCGQPGFGHQPRRDGAGRRAGLGRASAPAAGDGRPECRLEGHEIIQSAPTTYVVDEARGVRNPSGMFCQRIGVAMHAVAVKPSPLRISSWRWSAAISMWWARCSPPMPRALPPSAEDEKQIGATVIDMGGGCTSIAVFLEGHLVHADVVPMGGFSVTHDISRGLTAPLSAAERIKTLFGAALGDLEAGADVISVPQMGEEGEDSALRVPRSMLTRIIQARLDGDIRGGAEAAAGLRL